MKTNTFLFFLSGLAIGAFCGITAGEKSSSSETSTHKTSQPAAPRFGDKNMSPSPKPKEKRSFRTGLEERFMAYSRMSAEEISAELKKMDKDGINPTDMKSYAARLYLGQRWGQIAPAQAIDQCAGLKNIRGSLYSDILTGWANKAPEQVAAYYMENRGDGQALSAAIMGLAKAYPEKAWQWLDTLSAEERKEALPYLFIELAGSHPDDLSQTIQRLLPETGKNQALRTAVAREWILTDEAAARKWMDSLPGTVKNNTLEAAFSTLAENDPDKAIQNFQTLDGEMKEQLLSPLLETLSAHSPEKALDWLLKNYPEEKALPLITEALGKQAPASAQTREYVMQMDGGPAKDQALEHLISLTPAAPFNTTPLPVPPEDNLELAARITDPNRQEKQRAWILQQWIWESPKKAKAWIRQSDFSAQQKEYYLEELPQATPLNEKEALIF